jgi:hypothetical protein
LNSTRHDLPLPVRERCVTYPLAASVPKDASMVMASLAALAALLLCVIFPCLEGLHSHGKDEDLLPVLFRLGGFA